MRTLTSTLLAAQRSETRTPYVKAEARNDPLGVVNLQWERVYSGTETEGPHALTLAGDGSLIRMRISSAAESRRVYRQRVISPGGGSDYSAWTYLNNYNVMNAAACSLGAETSLFWVKASTGEIERIKSTDNGATWGSVDYPGYAPTGDVYGMTAAYKPNGDLFLFFTDGTELYLIKCLAGVWQSIQHWNKTTGNLAGCAVIYDGDWKLLVSGRDTDGNYRLWSLIYGDGGELMAGSWGDLEVCLTAPSDSGYEFGPVFMDKPDILRYFCNEKYTGEAAYNRPLGAQAVTAANAQMWTEGKPFNYLNTSGLAMAHSAAYAWASGPQGVWRAPLAAVSLDLSQDILSLKGELGATAGKFVMELQNADGQYSAPGSGDLAILKTGCRIDLSPGYHTTEGVETSDGLSFILRGWEHSSAPGEATLTLYASDSWEELSGWTARYPLRWNADPNVEEASVQEILMWVLARVGINLDWTDEDSIINTFYPDFTIQAGDNSQNAVEKLLSLVPHKIFIEGAAAYLFNPQTGDAPVYAYGTTHVILEGHYQQNKASFNRVQVEGWEYDVEGYGADQHPIIADLFNWTELDQGSERLERLMDLNLKTAAMVLQRGEIILRKAETAGISGWIRAPLNCGLQLMDVIDITDPRAGLAEVKKRVAGISMVYLPKKAEYEQKIYLLKP